MDFSPARRTPIIVILLLAVAAMNASAVWFVLHERQIYTYDSIGYWWQAIHLARGLVAHPIPALRELWMSTRQDLYPLSTVLPFLLTAPLGFSRLWYILTIVNVLAVPAVACFLFLLNKVRSMTDGVPPPFWTFAVPGLLATALDANFWRPVVAGMPDVGGTVILFLVLAALLPRFPSMRWRDEAAAGAGFFLLARFRRWYLYWIVSFFVIRCAFIAYTALRERNMKSFLRNLSGLLLCLGIFSVLLFGLTLPFALEAAHSDLRSMYAAFQIPDFTWARSLTRSLHDLGMLPLLLSAAGFCVSLKSPRLRMPSVFLFVQTALVYYLFARTQTFAFGHYYLLLPTLLFFEAYFLSWSLRKVDFPVRWSVLYSAIALTVFAACLSPSFAPVWNEAGHWFPSYYYPPVRTDVPEMQRLYALLASFAKTPEDTFYVLANGTLTEAQLKFLPITFPSSPDLERRFLPTKDIDARDGFPNTLFTARYVIVAEPVQVLLRPEDSQIVILPAQRILSGEGLGKAYAKKEGEFTLENGVRALVFERTRNVTAAEIQELSDALRSAHPDLPAVYQPNVDPRFLTNE